MISRKFLDLIIGMQKTPSLQKKKPGAFAELFSLVRETGLDSHGSPPLGQRRSQATLWPDSLRLLQVLFLP